MKKTICDKCGREFEGMDEYTSCQGVHIKIEIISGRRGHQFPRHYDFDDFICALEYLKGIRDESPELIYKAT